LSEFSLIRRHFTRATPGAVLGVGDDAALLQISAGQVLAVSSDMLVAGTHFFPEADPFLLGHKTLAVNISDLAAMGATPRWATLAVSLSEADDVWLERFSAGWFALARQHGVELVGGDTTRGPLNLCVTIMGEVPAQAALRRDGAQLGDDIWVSGALGEAALALAHLQGRVRLGADHLAICAARLHQPQPRVALGLALRGLAHSAIDISDGLLADLGHILESSGVGAELDFAALPLSPPLRALCGNGDGLAQRCALAGGDDYELCFTAAASCRSQLAALSPFLDLPLTRIGKITPGRGCVVRDAQGKEMMMEAGGYDHFA
jgi:thiamine-monophosphate kinase